MDVQVAQMNVADSLVDTKKENLAAIIPFMLYISSYFIFILLNLLKTCVIEKKFVCGCKYVVNVLRTFAEL